MISTSSLPLSLCLSVSLSPHLSPLALSLSLSPPHFLYLLSLSLLLSSPQLSPYRSIFHFSLSPLFNSSLHIHLLLSLSFSRTLYLASKPRDHDYWICCACKMYDEFRLSENFCISAGKPPLNERKVIFAKCPHRG